MPHDALPPDPFAGDPDDPARALGALDGPGGDGVGGDAGGALDPLDDEERAELVADLTDLAVYEALLAPRGVRGIVVNCADCSEQHFHDWELLRASLQHLLDAGTVRPHEPAFSPDPAAYVSWDYCRGYTDAVLAEDADQG